MAPRGRPCLPRGQGWVWQRLPPTRASGSGGEGKETRTRGSAGDDAALMRPSNGMAATATSIILPSLEEKHPRPSGCRGMAFLLAPAVPQLQSLISAQPAEGE